MSTKTKIRKGETQKAPFSRHVEIFLEMMAAERGASANTIEAYNRDLHNFGLFMQRRREKIENADTKRIKQYLSKLYAEGRAATTRARHLSVLRQFFAFLFAEGLKDYDPTQHISSPKKGRVLPKVLNKQEVEKLLSAARTRDIHNDLLLTTLMEILYATGLRVSELVSLRTDAISRDGQIIIVRGKGDKERIVPLGDPAREAVAAYLDKYKGSLEARMASPFLFPSRGLKGHLTRAQFSNLLKELAEAAGIDQSRVSPHILRHSFASHMLANGADLRTLQQLLGHADISTTEIYTHVLEERLKGLVEHNHPLANHDLASTK